MWGLYFSTLFNPLNPIAKLVKEKHFHGLCLYKYKNINDDTDLKSFENKFYILHDKHDLDKLLSDEK